MTHNEHDSNGNYHGEPEKIPLSDYDPKAVALAMHLQMLGMVYSTGNRDEDGAVVQEDADILQAIENSARGCYYWADGHEWTVLTDYEADKAAREMLEDIYADCYECSISENLRPYVDVERWMNDAIQHDGRGHILASYDGEEREQFYQGEYYYIYKN